MDDSKGIKNVERRNVPWQGVGTRLFCTSTISIQLPELIEPPLFISCLINTLLLSEAKVPRPFYLFLFPFFARRSEGWSKQGRSIFLALPFFATPSGTRGRKFVSFVRGVSFAEASLFSDKSDSAFSSLFQPILLVVPRLDRVHRFDCYLRSSASFVRFRNDNGRTKRWYGSLPRY